MLGQFMVYSVLYVKSENLSDSARLKVRIILREFSIITRSVNRKYNCTRIYTITYTYRILMR